MVIQPPPSAKYASGDYPLVSCICPTYNRPALLEESIQCFLDQTYPNKELIILADNPNCKFYLDRQYPQVHLINVSQRFSSLGQKYNYLRAIARGKYICIWEDDDLFGFNRIQDSVTNFNPNYDVIKSRFAIASVNNEGYVINSNLYHSGSCFSELYFQNKPFNDGSFGIDVAFEQGAKHFFFDPNPLYWYIYRWGNCHHLSGHTNAKDAWELLKDTTLEGNIELKPQYHRPYWKDIASFYRREFPEYVIQWESLYFKYL